MDGLQVPGNVDTQKSGIQSFQLPSPIFLGGPVLSLGSERDDIHGYRKLTAGDLK